MFAWLQSFVAPFVIAFGGTFWHDSVRGDRVTVVKIGDEVKVVTFEELFNMFSNKVVKIGDREFIPLEDDEVYVLSPIRVERRPEYYMTDKELRAYQLILKGGLSQRAIAEMIGASRTVVSRALEKARSNLYVVVGGWAKVKYIERHKVRKRMYRIATKYGETVVTEDHSLVTLVNGKFLEVKPTDINRKVLPARIHIIEDGEVDRVDLWKYITEGCEVSRRVIVKCRECGYTSLIDKDRFTSNKDYRRCWRCHSRRVEVIGETSYCNGFYLDGEVIRYVKSNFKISRILTGDELKAFLRIVSAYVSEGCLTDAEERVVILNSDREWLEELGKIASKYFNVSYSISKRDVYFLILDSVPLKRILEKLCGRGAFNKKLPDFTLRLGREYLETILCELIKGDGYREKRANRPKTREFVEKYFRYTSISKKLIAQLCFILSKLGIKYSIWYDLRRSDCRREKVAYTIATVTKYWREEDGKVIVEDVTTGEEYVYDVEVEGTHKFVDGIGLIVLHNTISLVIPPTKIPIDVSYIPDPNFKCLIIGLTFGKVYEFNIETEEIGPEIQTVYAGIWHAQEGYMDWHWDPFVESILKTNPYPQLVWSSRDRPYELRIVNKTDKYLWCEATFWVVKFPRRVYCPIYGECDPEDLFRRYMQGICTFFLAMNMVGIENIMKVIEKITQKPLVVFREVKT